MSNYVKALRAKLTFPSTRGNVSLQDIFDVPLKSRDGHNLNDIAKSVNRAIKDAGEEDFVTGSSKVDPALAANKLRLEILKDVIQIKETEAKAKETGAARAAERQQLLALRDQKATEALQALTPAEIEARLKALDASDAE